MTFNLGYLKLIHDSQLTVTDINGTRIGLESICYAPLLNSFSGPITVKDCTVQSVLGYFGSYDGLVNHDNYLEKLYTCIQSVL